MSRPKAEASSQKKTTKDSQAQQARTKKATPQKATAKARAGQAGAPEAPASQRRAADDPAGMPGQAQPREALLDYDARQQIAGVVVAVIGIALLVFVLAPTSGIFAQGVNAFLHTLLGVGAILVPIALIAWSVTIFTQRVDFVPARVIAGLLLVALAVMVGFGMTAPGCAEDPSALFDIAALRTRGGYVGNGLAWVLLSHFGQGAGLVVTVGVAVAGLFVIGFDISSVVLRARARRQQARARGLERRASREQRASWRYDDEPAYQDDLPEDYTPTVLFDPEGSRRPRTASRPVSPAQAQARATTTLIPFDQDELEPEDLPVMPPASVMARAGVAGSQKTTLLDDTAEEELHGGDVRFVQGGMPSPADEPARPWAQGCDAAPQQSPRPRSQGNRFVLDESLPQPPQSLVNKRARRASSGWWDPADEWRRDEFDPNDLGDGSADSLVPGVIPGAPLYYDEATADANREDNSQAQVKAYSVSEDVPAHGSDRADEGSASLAAVSDDRELSAFEAARASKGGRVPAGYAPAQKSVFSGGSEAAATTSMRTATSAKAGEDVLEGEQPARADWAVDSVNVAGASWPETREETADDGAYEPPWEEPGEAARDQETPACQANPRARRAIRPESQSVFAEQPACLASSRQDASLLAGDGGGEPALDNDRPYELPPVTLAKRSNGGRGFVAEHSEDAEETAAALQSALAEFGVDARVVDWVEGPTFTTYRLCPGKGVRVKKISELENDIARTLAATSVRIYSPVAGTNYVGVEVANGSRRNVAFGDVLPCVTGGPLDFAVGLDAGGKPVHADLGKLPHLLIAGTTGSGKSVTVNSIILSMLMRDTPEELRLIIVDPKQVEFSEYAGIPHLAMPVVTDSRQAAAALQWAVTEMDRRYRVFSNLGVRDLASYNSFVNRLRSDGQETNLATLPCVVVVIDELADLMMVAKKDVEASIVRVAQLGRAAGIHLVLATQTPRADIVTGLIRANVANRIALRVSKGTDSQIIIDQKGAEKLLPHGDMLYLEAAFGDIPRRIQGCNITDEEKSAILAHIKAQPAAKPCAMAPMPGAGAQLSLDTSVDATGPSSQPHDGGNDDDPLAWEAAKLVVENQLGSTSMLQRRMKLGYARAGRVMDMLEEMGVVGPARGSKPRDVLVADLDELETLRSASTTSGE